MDRIDELNHRLDLLYRLVEVMSRNLTEVTNLTLLLSARYLELKDKMGKDNGGVTWN